MSGKKRHAASPLWQPNAALVEAAGAGLTSRQLSELVDPVALLQRDAVADD